MQCWRVERYSIIRDILAVRFSCPARFTNLLDVLRHSFPDGTFATHLDRIMLADQQIRFGGHVLGNELNDLMALLGETVSVRDACDVSECLAFYRNPEYDGQEPDGWPYTKTGVLVHDAKYRGDRMAGAQLGSLLVSHIARHRGLQRACAITAIPSSGSSGTRIDWPSRWADEIARQRQIPRVTISRTRPVHEQKNVEADGDRAANQRGSMRLPALEGSIIVVDDLYMTGETMAEACRSAREAGATSVFALSAVKTRRGARGAWV